MSVAAVVELSHELHRLAVAGTGLAKGDRRIAALLPAFEKSGEKAPVFARIAERTSALLAASKADAPAEFLQLNTLVGAVLKTQGKAGVDGELVPMPPSATTAKRIPMRALNELRDGLYGGRTGTLDDAIERGWFGDARLAPFALDALVSDDAALANLAARKLVPPYGKALVPRLVASLDVSLKRPAARIIETVGRIDAASGAALARQILDPEAERTFELVTDGVKISDEAYAAALASLGDDDVDRGVLLDFVGAKRKALRVAALSRLLALGDGDAEARAVAMLEGSAAKAREAIEAIPALSGSAMVEPVAARAHALATALDAKKPVSADANDALRLLSLFARSEADPACFEAAFVLFERIEQIRSVASGLRWDELSTLFQYLMKACPATKHEVLARSALSFSPRLTAHAAIRAVGPAGTLGFLEFAKKDDLAEVLKELFAIDFDTGSYRSGDLPPLSEWSVEWLELGLRHELPGPIGYLWPLDPPRVVARVLAPRKIGDGELVVAALVASPGCAGEIHGKLDRKGRDHEWLDTLCAAIADGERERALEAIEAIPYRYHPDYLDTLRTRLADHFARTSA